METKKLKECSGGMGGFDKIILINCSDIKSYDPLILKRKYGDNKREVYEYKYQDYVNNKIK